eukprot:jgi/Mesvir1/22817/Mv25880-RA.1
MPGAWTSNIIRMLTVLGLLCFLSPITEVHRGVVLALSPTAKHGESAASGGPSNWSQSLLASFHTSGRSSPALSDWGLVNVSACHWSGVQCDENGQITALRLRGRQLQGILHDSLGQLETLQEIDLGDNLLSGTLPRTLGRLPALRLLDVSFNRISGAVPPKLSLNAQLVL